MRGWKSHGWRDWVVDKEDIDIAPVPDVVQDREKDGKKAKVVDNTLVYHSGIMWHGFL